MAEAAIGVFLGLAKDLMTYNYDLFSDVKDDFDHIYTDIKGFEAFLQDAAGWHDSKSIQHLIAQMRDVAYEAEDVIETYVLLNQRKGYVDKLLDFRKLHDVAPKFFLSS